MPNQKLSPGNIIEIPAWNVSAEVQQTKTPMFGSDDAVGVLLQEDIDDPEGIWTWYRLEPGEFEILE